jgi:glyoxylase-like metal-dependent hydrolase (beta-lactamase superfamily II)
MIDKGNTLMIEVATGRDNARNRDVLVTPGIPAITSDLAPGTKQLMWSPISSTLISGNRDAVLVDTVITVKQAEILVDWVAASGKNLTTIYVTHGHRDHSLASEHSWIVFPMPERWPLPMLCNSCANRPRLKSSRTSGKGFFQAKSPIAL